MTTDLAPPADVEAPSSEGPLRLLYLNRLERRKGIIELISAVRSLPGRRSRPDNRWRRHDERPGWNVHAGACGALAASAISGSSSSIGSPTRRCRG